MAGRWEGAAPVLEKTCHVEESGMHMVTRFASLPFPEEMGCKGHMSEVVHLASPLGIICSP